MAKQSRALGLIGVALGLPLVLGLAACSDSKSSSDTTTTTAAVTTVSTTTAAPTTNATAGSAPCTDAALKQALATTQVTFSCANGWAGGGYKAPDQNYEITFIAKDINGVWVKQDPQSVCPKATNPLNIPTAVFEISACKVS